VCCQTSAGGIRGPEELHLRQFSRDSHRRESHCRVGFSPAGKGPILAGLLTIAVADNISDSLGIHLYKESEGYGQRLSLLSTTLNFLSRLLISCTFIAIVLVLPMAHALYVGLVWGCC